jgi:hypothetical protein
MKTASLKLVLTSVSLFTYFLAFAQPTGRGGAQGDDNEWLIFLIIGLVVGAILGFLGCKYMGNSKK